MKRIIVLSLMVTIVAVVSTNYCNAQNNDVSWTSFDMGYANSTSSNIIVKSVIGQNFVGTSQQTNTQVISGFLADTLFRTVLVAAHEEKGLPTTYSLAQNYPNPFNPSTTLSFSIPYSSFVTLKVYDVLGREVATLVNDVKTSGNYTTTWNAAATPSGVYFYQLKAGNFTDSKKLLLMK